jgi:hypothetical protein
MRIRRRLTRLFPPVKKRLQRDRRLLDQAIRLGPSHAREETISWAIIDLRNTWQSYMRYYLLSCALRARSGGGVITHAVPAIARPEDFLMEAIRVMNPRRPVRPHPRRRDEPDWGNTHSVVQLEQHFQFSVGPHMLAAVSYQTRAFVDLPVARNFYAHRCMQTELAALGLQPNYGVQGNARVSDFLLSRAPNRPDPIAIEWVEDLLFVSEFLANAP